MPRADSARLPTALDTVAATAVALRLGATGHDTARGGAGVDHSPSPRCRCTRHPGQSRKKSTGGYHEAVRAVPARRVGPDVPRSGSADDGHLGRRSDHAPHSPQGETKDHSSHPAEGDAPSYGTTVRRPHAAGLEDLHRLWPRGVAPVASGSELPALRRLLGRVADSLHQRPAQPPEPPNAPEPADAATPSPVVAPSGWQARLSSPAAGGRVIGRPVTCSSAAGRRPSTASWSLTPSGPRG